MTTPAAATAATMAVTGSCCYIPGILPAGVTLTAVVNVAVVVLVFAAGATGSSRNSQLVKVGVACVNEVVAAGYGSGAERVCVCAGSADCAAFCRYSGCTKAIVMRQRTPPICF